MVNQTYTMHGPGKGSTAKQPVFSNEKGSKCSSLGHFAVTKVHGNVQKRGFRLKGLDPDNNNAYSRGIMIHNSIWVDTHWWMEYIPLNSLSCQGCVTVSSKGFKYLEKKSKSCSGRSIHQKYRKIYEKDCKQNDKSVSICDSCYADNVPNM